MNINNRNPEVEDNNLRQVGLDRYNSHRLPMGHNTEDSLEVVLLQHSAVDPRDTDFHFRL